MGDEGTATDITVAGWGPRAGAFAVDSVLSALAAWAFTAPELPRNWSLLAFAVLTVVCLTGVGQTPGMRLLGLRVVRVDRPARVGLWRAAVRTAGVILLVPVLLTGRDRRGLHDRLAGTAIVHGAGD